MSYPDPNEARAERQFDKDRRQSKSLYREKQCWASKNWQHDWRAASNAPGWVIGDDCVICQNCQLRAIASSERDEP